MLKDFFNTLNDLYTNPSELAAIWLDSPVKTSKGVTVRLEPDMLLCIKEGKISDGEFTHKIIGCYGTLINQFEISLLDLNTQEPSILKL